MKANRLHETLIYASAGNVVNTFLFRFVVAAAAAFFFWKIFQSLQSLADLANIYLTNLCFLLVAVVVVVVIVLPFCIAEVTINTIIGICFKYVDLLLEYLCSC